MSKFACIVYWVFKDNSRKPILKTEVEASDREHAKIEVLRRLDYLGIIGLLYDPPNLDHYEIECCKRGKHGG